MALLDFFKKKPAPPKPKKAPAKEAKKPVVKQEEKKKLEKPVAPRRIRKPTGDAYKLLKSPHVTEKAADLTGKNQYVFNVWTGGNKTEIRKAVEEVYKVDVLNVRIINVKKKKRRLGKITGWRQGYKKAIVKIRKGQKLEIMPR